MRRKAAWSATTIVLQQLLALRIVNTQGQGRKPNRVPGRRRVRREDKGFRAALTARINGGFQPVSVVNQPAVVIAVPTPMAIRSWAYSRRW